MIEAFSAFPTNTDGEDKFPNQAYAESGRYPQRLNRTERNMDIPTIPGERSIRKAARRAVRHDGIVAVGLFGSRARGTNREDSDWDLCAIGTREPDDLWECFGFDRTEERIDLSWLGIDRIKDGAMFGEFSGEVARDWKTLAGDDTPVRNLEIKPMNAEMLTKHVARNLATNLATACRELVRSEDARRDARRTEAPEDKEIKLEIMEMAHTNAMRASADAAEALCKGIVGSLGYDPAKGHEVKRSAGKIRTGSKKAITGDQRSTIENLSMMIDDTNDLVSESHGALYRTAEETEPFDKTRARTIKVMELHRTAMEGILEGRGMLAGLRQMMAEPWKDGDARNTPTWGTIHDAWVKGAQNAMVETDSVEADWERRLAGTEGIDRRLYDEYGRWRETSSRLKSVTRKGPEATAEERDAREFLDVWYGDGARHALKAGSEDAGRMRIRKMMKSCDPSAAALGADFLVEQVVKSLGSVNIPKGKQGQALRRWDAFRNTAEGVEARNRGTGAVVEAGKTARQARA